MVSVKSNSDFLAVTLKNKAIVCNFSTGTIHNLEFNPNQDSKVRSNVKNSNGEQNTHAYESVFLPCCDISPGGQWFAFCVNKCLLLWNTQDWSLFGTGILQRSPTKITFTPDGNKIIIADKGGDVYVFLKDKLSTPGSFLLGHLSLLFDVIITQDEKYIVTCDRDEKIRVSCYPNAYSIESYCMGHKEFVTCVKVLPHCQNILISSSGDETLRFWDFKLGTELLSYLCFNDLDKLKFLLDANYDDEHTAILKFETFLINTNESGVCVLLDCYKGCVIYGIKGTDKNLTCNKLQNINLDTLMHDAHISNDLLWLTSNEEKSKVSALKWNNISRNFEFNVSNEKVNNAVITVNKCLNNIEINGRSSFSVLYKKQFDGVQEYYKRKSDIFCKSSKKNKVT